MTETIEVSIHSQLEYLDLVGAITHKIIARLGFAEDDLPSIELAVHEAVVNAMTHGNHYACDKLVTIKFVICANQLTVYIRDRGAGFDTSTLPDPLAPQHLTRPSGRGIFLMRTGMDTVDFSIHPEGGSLVRMTKQKQS